MNDIKRRYLVSSLRVVQAIFVGALVLGAMWTGADELKLTVPQFLMLYGFVGTIASEIAVRLTERKLIPEQPDNKFRKGGKK